jgi:hypothetical protein
MTADQDTKTVAAMTDINVLAIVGLYEDSVNRELAEVAAAGAEHLGLSRLCALPPWRPMPCSL